jgi:hypothetical protein
MRPKHAFVLCLLVLVSLSANAYSCGDKWLVSPHSHGEHGGFTSLQPTEILIYTGDDYGSVDLELLDETMAEALRNAGHRVEFVDTKELTAMAADPRYELVLFTYEHAELVEDALLPLDRKPALLPLIADEKGDVEGAQDRFGWVVPCCSLAKLNQTIDELMILRVRGEA